MHFKTIWDSIQHIPIVFQETVALTVTASDCDDPTTNNTLLSYDILSETRVDQDPLPDCVGIFDISDDGHVAIVRPKKNLTGCWGEYDLFLSVRKQTGLTSSTKNIDCS